MNNLTPSVLPPKNFGFPHKTNCGLIEASVMESQEFTQVDRSLLYACALAAISTGLQGITSVRKPGGQEIPTGLLLLANVESGDGKTTGWNCYKKGIVKYQSKQNKIYISDHEKFVAEHTSWNTKMKSYKRKHARLSENGECTEAIEVEIKKHAISEPKPPRKPKLIYEDVTPAALFLGLYHDMPSAALISDEGGMVINGRGFSDIEKMSSVWSGSTITYDRLSKGSLEISGKSLTIFLGLQPSALKKYTEKKGEYARGSGIWARFLVCCPKSPKGSRKFTHTTQRWNERDRFADRLMEFLDQNTPLLKNPNLPKKVIKMSLPAEELWLRAANEIEAEIRPNGSFENAGDLASKLPDNIARVAALLHRFERMPGDISDMTMKCAIDICLHYADDFMKVFCPPPTHVTDAIELDAWFDFRLRRHTRYIQKLYVRRYGPSKLRESNRLEQALLHLQDNFRVAIGLQGRMEVVDLHPSIAHDPNRMLREIGVPNPGNNRITGQWGY